jgi:hypothetical protein
MRWPCGSPLNLLTLLGKLDVSRETLDEKALNFAIYRKILPSKLRAAPEIGILALNKQCQQVKEI